MRFSSSRSGRPRTVLQFDAQMTQAPPGITWRSCERVVGGGCFIVVFGRRSASGGRPQKRQRPKTCAPPRPYLGTPPANRDDASPARGDIQWEQPSMSPLAGNAINDSRSRSRKTLSLPKFSRDKQCHFDGETAAPLSPKDFNNIAQGRAAHRRVAVLDDRTNPERVQQFRGCKTPSGFADEIVMQPGVRCAPPGCVVERLRRKRITRFCCKYAAKTWVMTRSQDFGELRKSPSSCESGYQGWWPSFAVWKY